MPLRRILPLVTLCVPVSVVAAERPNVVLIMADDQGWGDIASHGNEMLDTPHLDRLASTGVRFDRFYVSPLCAPTRAGLLTGRHSLRSGVHGVTRGHETMRTEALTLAELFRDAGYVTGCFGKWHNGRHFPNHPNGQGFDEFFGFCGGHWNSYFDATLEQNGEPVASKGFITEVLTDAAVDFIRRNNDRPFLCYVPYNAPHFPPQVPDVYFDKYKARGCDDATATVYGMVENLDANVGRLLTMIDESDLAARTIVLFLTDNGPNTDRFNGSMKGRKGSAHEGGVRVPLFVRWTGRIEPGRSVRPIADHVDLLPTLCDLCDVSVPQPLALDGQSLAPLLLGDSRDWPDRVLFTFKDTKPVPDGKQGAVRTERHRAVRERGRWELYDMLADPEQKQDLATREPTRLRKLADAFDAKWREVTQAEFELVAIPIGHPQRPAATLPGHEANLSATQGDGISYHGRAGWANDWIDNWTDAEAFPAWPVEVISPGRYEIILHYCCPEDSVGSVICAEVGGQSVRDEIRTAHDPSRVTSPDRFPRPEVPEKVWKAQSLGTVRLESGRTELVLRAERIVGGRMPQVKMVEVVPDDRD